MANPQIENGFTPIANEIMEQLARVNLSPYESSLLWFLLRRTYGWKKKSDWISLSQFSRGVVLDRRLVHRTLKRMEKKGIIAVDRGDTNHPRYGFVKDSSAWNTPVRNVIRTDDESVIRGDDKKTESVIRTDDGVSSVEMMKVSSVQTPTKENNKINTTKDKGRSNGVAKFSLDESFQVFYREYPRKRNKGQAKKAWQKIKPTPNPAARVKLGAIIPYA